MRSLSDIQSLRRGVLSFLSFGLLLGILFWSSGCGEEASIINGGCEACPEGYREVERCPAFEECKAFTSCGSEFLCLPIGASDYEGDGDGDGDEDGACPDEPRCPPGSEEVGYCPSEEVCTLVNMCGVSLSCLELPEACRNEPLCPNGDRGLLEGRCESDDPRCYRHNHCSGPVICLRCEELPEECPNGQVAVDAADCEEHGGCDVVETCEETLYCAAVCLDEARTCPEPTIEIEDCPEESDTCFERVDLCEGSYFCGLSPEDSEDCRALPVCPDGLLEVEVGLCLLQSECQLEATCNQLIGCLPA